MADTDKWRAEAEAANRTIDRMGRQLKIYRGALETVAASATSVRAVGQHALDKARKIDEELWKRIPHHGKVNA